MLLDLLLAISITFSVLILMTALFIERPLEFSAFPTVLLIATMLRLSLNLASTRLILAHGHEGTAAAGHVIEAFGNFVMQGNFVIGVIVFAILVIVNFVVITKGSGRIAEVAARFTLDAMPGKQMAIDADLSAGLIDENEARERRKQLEDEANFFGAMDGASKFVRGDAIAGLLIIFINIIGGMIIGVGAARPDLRRRRQHLHAAHRRRRPGHADPRAASSRSPPACWCRRPASKAPPTRRWSASSPAIPQALGMSSLVMAVMAFLPGMPTLLFLLLSRRHGRRSPERVAHAAKRRAAEALRAQSAKKRSRPRDEPIADRAGDGLSCASNSATACCR